MNKTVEMKTSQLPSIPRSASEAELLKYVESDSNLLELAADSNIFHKGDVKGDERDKNLTLVQDQGINSEKEAVDEKKVVSYGSFCAKYSNSSRKQRVEAIKAFYKSVNNA